MGHLRRTVRKKNEALNNTVDLFVCLLMYRDLMVQQIKAPSGSLYNSHKSIMNINPRTESHLQCNDGEPLHDEHYRHGPFPSPPAANEVHEWREWRAGCSELWQLVVTIQQSREINLLVINVQNMSLEYVYILNLNKFIV